MKKSYLKKIIPYYKKYWGLLLLVIVLSWTYAGLGVAVPIYEGNLLSSFTNFNTNSIVKFAIFLIVLKIIIEVITNLWSMTVLKLNSKVNFDLKHNMLISLLKLQTKNFDYTNSGIFIARINKDSSDLSELFDDITDDLSEILLNVSFIIYSYFLNFWLGLYLTLTVVTLYFFISLKLLYFKKYNRDFKQKDETVVGSYADLVRGIRDIKNLNLKKPILEKINREQNVSILANKKMIHSRRTWDRYRASIQHFFDFIFILLSLFLISQDQLTVTAFLVVFVYRKNILIMINAITNAREKLANGSIAAERVFEIVDFSIFTKEQFGKIEIDNIKGNISFRNVKFCYSQEISLFDNLSFEIKENSMIAFVGKSGEGKSTILDLICKNYILNDGSILIDNISINELSEESIRKNISIVSQDPYIFNLSIKENIKLVKPNASEEEIINACKKAYIHDFIMSKPKGYDSLVGESGITLSGGQKQRLAIARALIKKSKIILFDEATSSLDNHSQEQIKKVMKELSHNHTIVIVAHRLSTIVDSDLIYVFDEHQIINSGTHDFLIKNCDNYRLLYEKESLESISGVV